MSNLLDKSSILLTPTAYENGKILSVKPAPSLSSELMPSTATIANLGGGSITQITENIYSSTSDGTSGSAVRPKFDFNTTSGKIYKLVITPIGTITGTINFDFYDGSTYLFQDYDFTTIKEITFTDNGTVFGAFNGQLAYSISNFKISVKEEIDGDFDFTRNSSATRVNSQGLIEDITSNLPRIDYTGGVGHWLFEPQSTNLVTYSEVYGSGTYFSSFQGSTFDNTTSLSPSGENNATQLTSTGVGKLQTAGISLSQNTDYTLSFYAKNVDATAVTSRVLGIGGSGGSNLIPISYFSELSTTEWKRITHSFNTGTNTTFYLYLSNALNSGGTMQLWGAQL